MPRETWYETDDPSRFARGASWRAGLWIVATILFFTLIGIGGWAFSVATSDVKGRGDATIQKNSANNRIAAQERFESLYAEVKGADEKLDLAAQEAKGQPASSDASVRYQGLVSYCIQTREDYDAEARKYSAQDFRSVDLPAQIDENDPATDCRPAKP